ncbi:hypothetical protein B0H19DRAFT_1273850 [Mycena capillaripes]|nr:hypothetical protein B0H19DRAFT_1273850 [Mycena capillaripes]
MTQAFSTSGSSRKLLMLPKAQAWWDRKAMSEWILPCLIKSQSPMRRPGQHAGGYEHWRGSSLDKLADCARKVDEGVLHEIEIALASGVLVNSRNESSHRAARNATCTSTTMRKSRESRELEDERAPLEMEINAEKEARNSAAARLKALQARNINSSPFHQQQRELHGAPIPTCCFDVCSCALGRRLCGNIGANSLSIPEEANLNVYGYGAENNQQFSDFAFNFDFSFLEAGPSDMGHDIAWFNSFMLDANMPYKSSFAGDYICPSSPPRLPPLPSPSPAPKSPVFDSLSLETAAASKKRKTRDEVDPANMIEGSRARKPSTSKVIFHFFAGL